MTPIEKLSTKDREIVVLRFIEDLDFSQITDRIGATEAACRKRLERALGKLHRLLSSHGTTISLTALASGLGSQFTQAAPPSLMQGLCQSTSSTVAQASGFNLLTSTLATTITFSKTMTVTTVAALAMIPIGLQWKEIRDLKSQLHSQAEESRPSGTSSVLPSPSAPSTNPVSQPASAVAEISLLKDDQREDTESFCDKMLRVMDDGSNQASEAERLEFWQSVRSSKELERLIEELNTTIENEPGDVENRLILAQAYIAKVWGSVSGSPEQGLWAAKAESMWKGALELEPTNWSAQRNIAFSYSQYPDFTNKTPDAIRE